MFLLFGWAFLIIGIIGFTSFATPNNLEVSGAQTSIITQTPTPTPTKVSRSDLDTSLTKVGPLKSSPNPTSIRIAPTSPPNNKTQDLLQQINAFRANKGLAPLGANSETCFFANLRSQEIISSFTHDGFRNRIDSKTLPYPSYSSVAENIAMNSDPNQVVPNWINSPGHNQNLSKDVPFGCVVGNQNYYVFEAWAP